MSFGTIVMLVVSKVREDREPKTERPKKEREVKEESADTEYENAVEEIGKYETISEKVDLLRSEAPESKEGRRKKSGRRFS